MCIVNTTSPAANNTTNVSYLRPDQFNATPIWEEKPEVIGAPEVSDTGQKKSSLKAKVKSKSQSSKTSGGTY